MTATRPYRLAEWYGEHVASMLPYGDVAAVVARRLRAADPPVGRVLEVACGAGNLTIPLAKQGLTLVGLDVAPEMVTVARRRARAAAADITFICRDMREPSGDPILIWNVYNARKEMR